MNPSSGGPCQGIRNIVPELEKLGLHNEVVCLDDPSEDFLGKDAFLIHAVGPASGPWAYSSKLIPWLLENFHRFDVIILHALWLYHGYALNKALQQYRRLQDGSGKQPVLPKVFIMPHGMLDPYFQQAAGRKMKALRNWAYWKLIEGKIVNEADGVLFTCKEELLLARIPFKPYHPKKEINIGYGVKAPPVFEEGMNRAFLEKCPGIGAEPFILFLGRIHEKKGIDHLIQAYSNILAREKNNDNTTTKRSIPNLVIAGPGIDTAFGKKMLQLVLASSLLKERIFFPGMLHGEAKWGAFYRSEVFILPSHQENFGIAVVEALACGKPVLISRQVNIWREITEAGAGFAEEDSTQGTEKLLASWQTMTLSEKAAISTRARSSFLKAFSITPAAKRFYEEMVI
ncbi:MAG: glycosyltransferase [Ferruginibacter sp.]